MDSEPPLIDLARATGRMLADRFRQEIEPPFEDDEISAAAAELMLACAAEFSLRPDVSASTAQVLGDVAALAFLARIDEIEKERHGLDI